MRISLSTAAIALGVLCGSGAAAQSGLPQGGDPYLPPAARQQPLRASPSGAALDAAVEAKLRATFDAADSARTGTLTREQAARAGWGSVVQDFEAIDTRRNGRVTFDEIRRYQRARAASR